MVADVAREAGIFTIVPVDTTVEEADLRAVQSLLEREPGRFFTARQIAVAVGLPSSGTQVRVRKAVKILQSRLVPIVSNDAGFSMATGPSMVRACLRRELKRQAGLDRSIRKMQAILESLGGQLTLDDIASVDGDEDAEV